jgi:hypothetical protein
VCAPRGSLRTPAAAGCRPSHRVGRLARSLSC